MESVPPADSTIVCPFCSSEQDLYIVEVEPSATAVRCPQCRRHFRLLTRFVSEARARVDRSGRRFYDFLTREPGGRDRMRSEQVSSGIQLRPGRWFTFVWRGDRLLGIADQLEGLWFPVRLHRRQSSLDRLWQGLVVVCLGLALVQAARLLDFTRDLIARDRAALLVLGVCALLLATPLVQWALTIAAEEEGEEETADPFA